MSRIPVKLGITLEEFRKRRLCPFCGNKLNDGCGFKCNFETDTDGLLIVMIRPDAQCQLSKQVLSSFRVANKIEPQNGKGPHNCNCKSSDLIWFGCRCNGL